MNIEVLKRMESELGSLDGQVLFDFLAREHLGRRKISDDGRLYKKTYFDSMNTRWFTFVGFLKNLGFSNVLFFGEAYSYIMDMSYIDQDSLITMIYDSEHDDPSNVDMSIKYEEKYGEKIEDSEHQLFKLTVDGFERVEDVDKFIEDMLSIYDNVAINEKELLGVAMNYIEENQLFQ